MECGGLWGVLGDLWGFMGVMRFREGLGGGGRQGGLGRGW